MISMNTERFSPKFQLCFAMAVFGLVGIIRRMIPMDSLPLACFRAFLGGISLYFVILAGGRRLDMAAIRRRLPLMVLVGVIMGFNWVFLFEAFKYTSVATATVCYYMEPVFIILASPFVFKERITLPKAVCVILSFIGMVLVSGVLKTGFHGVAELKGVFFGLLAAVFYATCVIWNMTIKDVPIFDRTFVELLAVSIVLLPISYFSGGFDSLRLMTPSAWIWLLVLSIFCTGITYGIYYTSVDRLPSQTVALYSYLDPVLAVLFSWLLLHESMGVQGMIGAVLIIGSALASDMIPAKRQA